MNHLIYKVVFPILLFINSNTFAQANPCNFTHQQLADNIINSITPTGNCNEYSFTIPTGCSTAFFIYISLPGTPFSDGINIFTITSDYVVVADVCTSEVFECLGTAVKNLQFEDCPTCPADLVITQTVDTGENDIQESSNTIIATNKIENGANAEYDSVKFVKLSPNFHAKAGSTFRAYIEGCDPPASERYADATNSYETILKDIILIPNPAKEKLHVSIENTKISSIELYNIYGNKKLNAKKLNVSKHLLDVNDLPRGYYILKVILKDGTIQYKNVVLN
ncbi:T9SS type A sorting domain-containing protein [Psychroserpens sp. SPM9]|uniref:T9SS type A sorting domain-containing protein n=1 Tax=Psychroserpens sp. SPM9 TaxID=2975598 RepID=UPI0021A3350F|nr:T9SS type A sorting domain-containing protein [Psychroserpens sp. SPM9]MDG5492969.1 T9SS type A sorting domain-containing protein [Psychroserpens sp. SPM9]